jgi:hypothetical protein
MYKSVMYRHNPRRKPSSSYLASKLRQQEALQRGHDPTDAYRTTREHLKLSKNGGGIG